MMQKIFTCHGNTPTSVGKTEVTKAITDAMRKHPHERGEDSIESALPEQV